MEVFRSSKHDLLDAADTLLRKFLSLVQHYTRQLVMAKDTDGNGGTGQGPKKRRRKETVSFDSDSDEQSEKPHLATDLRENVSVYQAHTQSLLAPQELHLEKNGKASHKEIGDDVLHALASLGHLSKLSVEFRRHVRSCLAGLLGTLSDAEPDELTLSVRATVWTLLLELEGGPRVALRDSLAACDQAYASRKEGA